MPLKGSTVTGRAKTVPPGAYKHGCKPAQLRKNHNKERGKKKWNPAYAKRIPSYPKTKEAFAAWIEGMRERMRRMNAEGRMGRQGIPDGWGGRGEELKVIRARAKDEAHRIVQHMIKTEVIGQPEDPRAEEALEAMIAIVRAKDDAGVLANTARDRISAANTVLTFTKQKPAAKADVSIRRAEDFLTAIADTMPQE